MLTAITRAVSPAIVHCELSFIDRKPIDLAVAQKQHHAYENLLGKLGARVISLPAEPALPDSMFVEDPAIVDRKSTRLNSSHPSISYAVFCLKKKKKK